LQGSPQKGTECEEEKAAKLYRHARGGRRRKPKNGVEKKKKNQKKIPSPEKKPGGAPGKNAETPGPCCQKRAKGWKSKKKKVYNRNRQKRGASPTFSGPQRESCGRGAKGPMKGGGLKTGGKGIKENSSNQHIIEEINNTTGGGGDIE